MKNFLARFKKNKTAEAVEQAIDPLEAPIELKGKVTGIKRMNKAGLYGMLGVVAAGIGVAAYMSSGSASGEPEPTIYATKIDEKSKLANDNSRGDWFGAIPEGLLSTAPAASASGPTVALGGAVPDLSGGNVSIPQNIPDLIGAGSGSNSTATNTPIVPPTPAELLRQQLEQRAAQKQLGAYDASPTVGGFGTGQAGPSGPSSYAAPAQVSGFNMPTAAQMAALAGQGGTPDQNQQMRKAAFLADAGSQSGNFYLKSLKETALSPYELKAGGLIPGVMISGINSDLPGQVSGQVKVDVYDTKTGRILLIPKGTRLIGSYDSQVSFGQSRVLMVWSRMLFPDTSSIDLKGMQGADGLGYSGFSDEVNNHYGKLFGGALLLSVVGAVNIASAPASGGLSSTPSPAQAAGTAATGAIAQIGGTWAQKQLSVQPTLEIRRGYEFNIVVNKDIVFPGPYTGK